MKIHQSHQPLWQRAAPNLPTLVVAAVVVLCSAAPTTAQVAGGLPPGTTVMTMDCDMGQGRYVGNNFVEGTVHGELTGPVGKRGTLRVYTADQQPFASEQALGDGPKLQYSITMPSGEQVVSGVGEIYTRKISEYPDYIILTGSSGRFLRLRRFQDRHFWGGYTGLMDDEVGLEQIVQYTPLSCSAPRRPEHAKL